MKKILLKLLFISILFISNNKIFAQATGFSVTTTKCNSLELGWSSSKAVIIIAKEGNVPPDFVPSDNTVYTAFPYFNLKGYSATTYGQNNYVVFNGSGSNSVTVDSLKPCTEYSFTIYEHDNNGSSTQYNPLSSSTYKLTYCLNLSFKVTGTDSCESHNQFEFKNNSSTTIPGLSYSWDFGDGTFGTGQTVNHSYSNKSGTISVNLNASNNLGCPSTASTKVRVYPKKVGYLDTINLMNPQCLRNNYFEIDFKPIVTPLPKSFTYKWNYGDGVTDFFKKMKHSYKNAGRFNLVLEIQTNVNQKPTGCYDTLRYVAIVLQDPNAKVEIKDSTQCLTNNLFSFQNPNTSNLKHKWDFGDGKFDTARNTTHQYAAIGLYKAYHLVVDIKDCADTFKFKLNVLNSANSSFSGLDSVYCAKNVPIKINTTSPYGQFFGYTISNNLFVPNTVGNYQLKYALRLKNCGDSTTKNFRIKSAPQPNLGANFLMTSSQTVELDAGVADSYLWNTGDTTQKITVNGSKLNYGANMFIVKAMNKNGCSITDTVLIGIGNFSNLHNTKQQLFNIYPNPVNSILHINASSLSNFDWVIYNMEGKTLAKGNQIKNEIDFSPFENGLYLIEFSSGTMKEIYKISKE